MKKRYLLSLLLFICISCDEIIGIEDISKEKISIIAPAHNSTVAIGGITFSWFPLSNDVQYHLQIVTPSFLNAVQLVEDTLLTQTSYSVELSRGSYEWRVKAINSEYETVYQTQCLNVINGMVFSTLKTEQILLD